MRRQAYDLRYIAEAPKLRVGEDEKPLLPEVEAAADRRGEKDKRRAPRPPPAPRGACSQEDEALTLEVRLSFFCRGFFLWRDGKRRKEGERKEEPFLKKKDLKN